LVTTANNGLEGVNALKKGDFDLVLMDIQMPKMDGYTATKYIRNNFENKKKNIPILAMTAHALDGEREKCIDSGMTDYLSKPIMKDVFENKLIKLLTPNPINK